MASRRPSHSRVRLCVRRYPHLSQTDPCDPHAAEQLLPLIYDELGKLAAVEHSAIRRQIHLDCWSVDAERR